MYKLVSRLLLYGDLGEDSILTELSAVFADWERGAAEKPALVRRVYGQVRRLLDLATLHGFDGNLWHDYLAFLLMRSENAFSLTCERAGASEGSINGFARADFAVFKALFDFDFSPIERDLGIDCFTALTHYSAIPNRAQLYHRDVSAGVRALSGAIDAAKDAGEVFDCVADWYRIRGAGMFGMNRAFRVRESADGIEFSAISNVDAARLSDLIGYEAQKAELRRNTEAFIAGRGANDMLLYGDAGTGKSTAVRALLNEYADQGLRMVELYKHQLRLLGEVIARLKARNYPFMVFIDDLSFEEDEVEYKFLKAVIEGGVETRPANVLICATSNRRHLVREMWDDRKDMEHDGDVHRSDTLEEKLSLAARFGCAVNFSTPSRAQYHDIVMGIAKRQGNLGIDEEQLIHLANRWELRHGGVSGRTAQQFINYLSGQRDMR